MRRLPAAALWYALAVLVAVGGPAAVVLLLGTPELALPSDWADARARIDDGTYPAGYVVDIVSGLMLLAWVAGLWFLVTVGRKRDQGTDEEPGSAFAGASNREPGSDPDEPWYRQGPPIFDEPFSDEYSRVVVPPDETAPGDEPADSPWQPAPVAAGVDEPFGMPPPDPMAEDMVADAEVIGGGGITGGAGTAGDTEAPDPDEPPMIVPVRAYYFTRAGDTLRSISAQFLNTPMRWEELRSLNAASPGVSALSADSLLPVGTALALPGDPLPWGKPDPVYLWTLAEKFLFTAWGREPTPEEVVPFWRGLTGGAQLEAGAPPVQVEHLAAPVVAEPPPLAPETADEPEPAEPPAPEITHEPEPAEPPAPEVHAEPEPPAPEVHAEPEPPAPEVHAEPEPPAPEVHAEPEPAEPPVPDGYIPEPAEPPAPEITHEPEPAEPPAPEVHAEPEPPAPEVHAEPEPPAPEVHAEPEPPAPIEPLSPAPTHEPEPAEPPVPDGYMPAPPLAPAVEPATPPTDFQPPPPITPPPLDSPVHPTYQPEPAPIEPPAPAATYQPEPAATAPAAAGESPSGPLPAPGMEPTTPSAEFQPPPPITPPPLDSPVHPTHEPAHAPAAYQPPPPYDSPVAPTPVAPSHEPAPYQPPVAPSHEPAPYQPPVPPSHEPHPPTTPGPGLPDLGLMEPEAPYVEAEVPRMPSFMPSLTGAESAAPTPEAEVMTSSNRSLAGTAIGDAMMLWQLSRLRRRRGEPDVVDPTEESLRQNARVDTLNFIDVAMRHLRAVTVGQLREKPAVLAVRIGTYGFEVLLSRPTQAPDGWQTVSGGYVLELPQGVTAEDLDATAQGHTLCPALIPVGDTLEGPLLLNIEEIGCLIVSGPGTPSVNLLNAVVGTLGSSPLAGDIRIITVGLDTPPGLPGWDRVHSTSFDSPQLEELLSTAHTGSGTFLDVLVVGPGNDILVQRAGQVATTPGSRLALVGATSSVAARWPWRIHVDETTTAVVHPIACTMAAAQATAPALSQLFSEAADPSLLAPPRY